MHDRHIIIACVATLMLVGLLMVYSNTAVSCGVDPTENAFIVRQVIWMVLSVAAIVVASRFDYHRLAEHSRVVLLVVVVGLAALLVLGARVNGARRWFRLGPMSLQVSEFAKIAVVLYLASFVSRKREVLGRLARGFLPPVLVVGAVCGLVLLEPDFGTAILIAAVGLTVLIAAGVRWRHMAPLFLVSAPLLFLFMRMKEYRWQRLIVFLDPWSDPQGAGYHVVQSLIALGCGGWTGVGPGVGLQQLGFLPESETDFIFAIYGQETGFVGCLLLIAVFVVLFRVGVRVARAAPDVLGALIALGVTVLIGFQMIINVGVAASAMPTKGLSLPFVSFGGSSILALSIGIGMLLNVAKHCPAVATPVVRGARRKEVAA